jgi:hypothetical protein
VKGQTPAVTAVLITTVIVGSVATAYVWGTPLLEKRQGQADLQNVENDVLQLHNKIIQVSESGSGTTERIEFNSGSETDLRVNPEEDYISVTSEAQQSPYPQDSWTLIKGKSLQNLSFGTGDYGIKTENLPGVVAVRPSGSGDNTVLRYQIEFRNLLADTPTGQRLQKIDIKTRGQTKVVDTATLLISNQGTEIDSGNQRLELSSGEKLERTRTLVEVDIR